MAFVCKVRRDTAEVVQMLQHSSHQVYIHTYIYIMYTYTHTHTLKGGTDIRERVGGDGDR